MPGRPLVVFVGRPLSLDDAAGRDRRSKLVRRVVGRGRIGVDDEVCQRREPASSAITQCAAGAVDHGRRIPRPGQERSGDGMDDGVVAIVHRCSDVPRPCWSCVRCAVRQHRGAHAMECPSGVRHPGGAPGPDRRPLGEVGSPISRSRRCTLRTITDLGRYGAANAGPAVAANCSTPAPGTGSVDEREAVVVEWTADGQVGLFERRGVQPGPQGKCGIVADPAQADDSATAG